MTDIKTIGEKVRQARVLKKLSQLELGTLVNLGKQAIYNIESGNRAVTADELIKIAEATSKPLSFFYEEEPEITVATNHKINPKYSNLKESHKKIIDDLIEEFSKEDSNK